MEGTTNVISGITELTSYLLTLILTIITDFIALIMANPYLLIGVCLMLIGAGVSFLKRLIRV